MLRRFLLPTKDVDICIEENQNLGRSPNRERILLEHSMLKERILALFHEAMLRGIDFKVWPQINGIIPRIDTVKDAVGNILRLGTRSVTEQYEDDVFIDEPRKEGEELESVISLLISQIIN